jgi:hypothetical protein
MVSDQVRMMSLAINVNGTAALAEPRSVGSVAFGRV